MLSRRSDAKIQESCRPVLATPTPTDATAAHRYNLRNTRKEVKSWDAGDTSMNSTVTPHETGRIVVLHYREMTFCHLFCRYGTVLLLPLQLAHVGHCIILSYWADTGQLFWWTSCPVACNSGRFINESTLRTLKWSDTLIRHGFW